MGFFSINTLDAKTLALCFGILSCLQCVAFYMQYRINRSENGLLWWTCGSACMSLGFLVNFFRDIELFHNFIVIFYNMSFVVGMSLICVGVYRFENKKIHLYKIFAINVLALVFVLYYTSVVYSLASRRIVVSLALALFSLLSICALHHARIGARNTASRFLQLLFGFNVAWLLFLSLPDLLSGSHAVFFTKPTPLIVSYLMLMIISTLWTFGLIVLVNQNLTAKLEKSKLFLESTLNGLSANIALLNEQGDIILVNKAWMDFAVSNGMKSPAVFNGMNYIKVCDDSSAACAKDALNFSDGIKSVLSGKQHIFTTEYSCHSDSLQRWFVGRVTPFPGDGPKHVVVAHEDITTRKLMEIALEESNKKLAAMTNEDGLTKISNRRHFDAVLASECSRHARNHATLSVILLDIDYFKNFNDSYGHVQGDECLQRVAFAISHSLKRPTDLAARYGGEEFACLLPETDLIGAVSVAEGIRKSIEELSINHSTSLVSTVVTVSVGLVSLSCDPGTLPSDVVKYADALLYRAKNEGRNRVAFKDMTDVPYSLGDHAGKLAIQISWRDGYSSGNKGIDEQHMFLVALANDILKVAFSKHDTEKLTQRISTLLLHVAQHFKYEEEILTEIGFPNVDAHIAEHERLLERCMSLMRDHSSQPIQTVDVLQYIIHDLVMQHMFRDDVEYYPFITSNA
ncbi:diguanylate cyclase [Megalodesulfovibrio gigas]|uniref:diguanylate cyclase n=1 Tax=Megalodesulfovibrio gigas (strain ATCC 19364 / DSM 1382 / NCIMB 9332 / VKM B-1759) TaxID=1121448 RepID=T2G942_MEGG1|nr:diguanylate cyclase [Megalodesulfovibrio gigas]AGW13095.1 putative GGDEF domain protein [Megalodesulfovibrio gigas DSM 1382 = ATCC 19364]